MKNLLYHKKVPMFIVVFAVLLSFCLHFPIFNYDIIGYHVWRQTQTQTVIENFCGTDFCILNPRLNNLQFPDGIIRMEFPLYQWIVAGVCRVTGNHVLTTRVVTFIIGVFSIIGFFLLSKSIFKSKLIGAIGAWAFSFSPVFYYYTVNPLPDDLALCFGMYGLYFFVKYFYDTETKYLVLFSLFISLACLSKLPFILFAIPFAVYWFRSKNKLKEFSISLLFLLPAIVWYASVIGTWKDNGIVKGILDSNIGLGMYLYHLQGVFVSVLPELFINYAGLFVFFGGVFFLFRHKITAKSTLAKCFLIGLLGVLGYTLFELNMITTEHDYYLFPFLPFLFLISIYGFSKLTERANKFVKVLAVVSIMLMPLTAYLRINQRWNLVDPGFNPALLNHKNEIQKIIPENAVCLTGNDDSRMINLYYLNRKGYTFYEDDLDGNLIEEYKRKGVSYLVSDAVLKDETVGLLPTPVAIFDNVKIYKLK